MRVLYLLILIVCISCKDLDQFQEKSIQFDLQDSVNLADLGLYVISDFNYATIDEEITIIVDLFGGQLHGLKNGVEKFYALDLNDVEILEGNNQVGNVAFSELKKFLYFPHSSKILILDNEDKFEGFIQLKYQNDIISDKYNSLFEYNKNEKLFYVTLYRNAQKSMQYSDVPLVGAYNTDGDLVKTMGTYPDNYKKLASTLTAWKYSFFDKDANNYYSVFNRNNLIYKYDKAFNLVETINLPDNFIEQVNNDKVLNSFKKHPTKNIFFIIENEEFKLSDGSPAVRIQLKWFNADNNTYGIKSLNNYMRIHQITDDDRIILMDRNSYEDAFLFRYKFNLDI